MRTPAFISVVLAILALPCVAADSAGSQPILVVRQFADYPGSQGSRFPGGLIAALWSDGRMIRPAGSNTVGKSYVEGVVSATDRDKFFAFLTNSTALRNQPSDGDVELHAAYQTVTLRKDGKKSRWTRPLPDRKAGFYEVEDRLWGLSLEGQRSIDWKVVRRSNWYD